MELSHLYNYDLSQDRSQAEDFFKTIFSRLAGGLVGYK